MGEIVCCAFGCLLQIGLDAAESRISSFWVPIFGVLECLNQGVNEFGVAEIVDNCGIMLACWMFWRRFDELLIECGELVVKA